MTRPTPPFRRHPKVLAGIEACLLVAGVGLLFYCAYVLVDSWTFQRRESRWLNATVVDDPGDLEQALETTRRRGVLGRLEIPRLSLSTVVIEGTDDAGLRRAAGRITDSALPGFDGNVAIAGHRDMHFRPLRDVRAGDRMRLVTAYGEFLYEVEWMDIVDPDRVDVLDDVGHRALTLVTCYPFKFIGKAPLRFVVRAREIERAFHS